MKKRKHFQQYNWKALAFGSGLMSAKSVVKLNNQLALWYFLFLSMLWLLLETASSFFFFALKLKASGVFFKTTANNGNFSFNLRAVSKKILLLVILLFFGGCKSCQRALQITKQLETVSEELVAWNCWAAIIWWVLSFLLEVDCINRDRVYSYISTTLFYETQQIAAQ